MKCNVSNRPENQCAPEADLVDLDTQEGLDQQVGPEQLELSVHRETLAILVILEPPEKMEKRGSAALM